MNLSADFLGACLTNPWIIAAIFVLLLVYRIFAARTHKFPRIPVGFLLVYLGMHLLLYFLRPLGAPELVYWLNIISIIILYCAIAQIAFAITIDYWFLLRKHSSFPKITRDFILLATYAIIAFVVLRTRGNVNLVGLITTSAVLTAVIGLAAQNSLGNLFAGISLQLEQPYRIGDWIQYGDNTGQVVSIGWSTTRLRTFEDEIVFVPNMDIAKATLKNFSRPSKRHVMKIDIGLDYNAAPNCVRKAMLDALNDEPCVIKAPAPQIRVIDFGDFAVKYQLRFFYDDYGTSPVLRADIMNRLWYALRRNRINIPYPVRDLHLKHVERRVDLKRREEERLAARRDLDTVPILAPLSAKERDFVAERMLVKDFGEGETIVRQGDAGDSMYILHSGSCDVVAQKDGSQPIKVATLTAPSFFGEMSLLTGDSRSATVQAKEDSRLFRISKDTFRDILSQDPSIFDALAKALAKRQADTAAALNKQSQDTAAQASKLLPRIKAFFGIG